MVVAPYLGVAGIFSPVRVRCSAPQWQAQVIAPWLVEKPKAHGGRDSPSYASTGRCDRNWRDMDSHYSRRHFDTTRTDSLCKEVSSTLADGVDAKTEDCRAVGLSFTCKATCIAPEDALAKRGRGLCNPFVAGKCRSASEDGPACPSSHRFDARYSLCQQGVDDIDLSSHSKRGEGLCSPNRRSISSLCRSSSDDRFAGESQRMRMASFRRLHRNGGSDIDNRLRRKRGQYSPQYRRPCADTLLAQIHERKSYGDRLQSKDLLIGSVAALDADSAKAVESSTSKTERHCLEERVGIDANDCDRPKSSNFAAPASEQTACAPCKNVLDRTAPKDAPPKLEGHSSRTQASACTQLFATSARDLSSPIRPTLPSSLTSFSKNLACGSKAVDLVGSDSHNNLFGPILVRSRESLGLEQRQLSPSSSVEQLYHASPLAAMRNSCSVESMPEYDVHPFPQRRYLDHDRPSSTRWRRERAFCAIQDDPLPISGKPAAANGAARCQSASPPRPAVRGGMGDRRAALAAKVQPVTRRASPPPHARFSISKRAPGAPSCPRAVVALEATQRAEVRTSPHVTLYERVTCQE